MSAYGDAAPLYWQAGWRGIPGMTAKHFDLFTAKVDVRDEGQCWHWTAVRSSAGYGQAGHLVQRRRRHAGRFHGRLGDVVMSDHGGDDLFRSPRYLAAHSRQSSAPSSSRPTRARTS